MKKALLLIDIQNDYFPQGKNELVNSVLASEKAKALLNYFRNHNLPIIHIQHLSVRPGSTFFIPDTEGAAIHKNVQPLENEKVIVKNYPNSFRETELQNYLQEQEVQHLVVAGMMSHMCVDATVRAAKDLGYQVTVAEDACATKDLSFRDKTIPAPQVHSSFMAALNYFYAEIKQANELIEQH
ncbi:MAG: cysteine hydrolase family protein [Flavisolibacter sp.]